MRGAERQRLDAALTAANPDAIAQGAADWRASSAALVQVSISLRMAASSGLTIGGRTGPALARALEQSASRVDEHARRFDRGSDALHESAAQIRRTTTRRDAIDADAPTLPALSYKPRPDLSPEQNTVLQESQKSTHAQASADREAERERLAREAADDMESGYAHPISVMQSIYGYEPPAQPTGPGGTDGGSGGDAGGSGGGTSPAAPVRGGHPGGSGHLGQVAHPGTLGSPPPSSGWYADDGSGAGSTLPSGDLVGPTTPTAPDVPGASGLDGSGVSDGDPSSEAGGGPGAEGSGASGGVPLGAVAGGVAGGAVLGGLAKGGVLGKLGATLSGGSVGSSRGGVLGQSGRAGAPGTLGRGATGSAVPGQTGARGSAAGGRGGASGGSGGRGGARSGVPGQGGRAGSRGAGGAAGTGRGGRKGDRERDGQDRDLFDDGSDWLDDEGAAPGVLD